MRRAGGIVALLLCAGALALAQVGCALKGMTKPALEPDTRIFIQGPVDTVNHVVHLYWFGSEATGYIAAYEVRLLNPAAPAETAWVYTTHTDSILTVLTPTGFTQAVFEARAIDDHGVKDPTPAVQKFNFRNNPPIVKLVNKPNPGDHSDTTFASATVDWTVSDPDGDPSKVICRVWLNGNEATPDVTPPGNIFTVPSSRFLVGGVYTTGKRTLFIQGIDDGGMAGPIDSVSWFVRAPATGPRARLLLIDDVPTTDPANLRSDTLYANAIVNAGLAPGTWSLLRPQFNQPFRSAKDMEQTFKQFEAVIWYRGEQAAFSTVLANFGDGIGPYLDSGGHMFLEAQNMTTAQSTNGSLSPDFVDRYMNSDGTFQYPAPPDSSAAWGIGANGVLQCPTIADSLQNKRILGGLRGFRVRSASQMFIVVPAHTLAQDNPYDFAVAVDVPQALGGRFVASTYPMVSGTISTPGFPQRASIVLLKIFGLLGLTGP
jgi:hypothetical protein